jgi:hypothetical protein
MSLTSMAGCAGSYIVILRCLTIAEKLSTPLFRRNLATAIRSASIFGLAARLPDFFIGVFDAIFTEKLWSLRGFFRSCLASVVIVALLLTLWYSSVPDHWLLRVTALHVTDAPEKWRWYIVGIPQSKDLPFNFDIDSKGQMHTIPNPEYHEALHSVTVALNMHMLDTFFFLPLFYNFLADFLALIVTREMLRYLSQQARLTIERFAITFFLTVVVIMAIAFTVLCIATPVINYVEPKIRPPFTGVVLTTPMGGIVSDFRDALLFPFFKAFPLLLGNWSLGTLYGVFIWSTFMGVAWVAMFGVLVVIANVSLRLKAVGPWLYKNFQVRMRPFRVLYMLAIIPVGAVCVVYHMLH